MRLDTEVALCPFVPLRSGDLYVHLGTVCSSFWNACKDLFKSFFLWPRRLSLLQDAIVCSKRFCFVRLCAAPMDWCCLSLLTCDVCLF